MVKQDFLHLSLRHLAAIREAPDESLTPFPEGWLDLPEPLLADFGAMVFLLSLSKYHMRRPLAHVFNSLEGPLRLSQYRIFRSGGYPRAFVTWAGLDHAAERQFAVERQPLRLEQCNSGQSLWVVDLGAPFGHLDQVIQMLAENRETNRVRTLWHNMEGTRARVLEWLREDVCAPITVASYGEAQFAKILSEEG